MEHDLLRTWAEANNFQLSTHKESMLLHYVRLIYSTGKKFNLTGLKSEQEIVEKLIIGSLDPVIGMDVPRGTSFLDIGTGAGIPGVPIAIAFENCRGTLVDSNRKKISFINMAIDELGLDNARALCGRIEEMARGELRGVFQYAFSRAMGSVYLLAEFAAPFLALGGFLYMYSSLKRNELDTMSIEHCDRVGLDLASLDDHARFGIRDSGILFRKRRETKSLYPRKLSVINREIKKIYAVEKQER